MHENIIPTKICGFDDIIGGGFPPGTCILLITPPMVEARLFCLEFVYRGLQKQEPGVVITMDNSPEDLKIKALPYNWTLVRGEQNGLLRWIDGYSINANKNVKDSESVARIGGPVALSDIAIALSKVLTDFHKGNEHYRFIFDSLSTLLLYNPPDAIYRFLESIVPKLRISGGVGFFTLASGMHDPKIEMAIRHMLDGAIQLDNDLNMKILGMPVPVDAKEATMKLNKTGFVVTPA